MARIVQIRGVPDDVHAALVARAERAGVSLSDLLRAELIRLAARPSMSEFLARLDDATPVLGGPPTPELIARDRRE